MLDEQAYTICHKKLIEYVVRERKKRKIKKFELAGLLHVSSTLIHRLETGERRIEVCDLIVLGQVIGFDPSKCVRWLQQHFRPKRKTGTAGRRRVAAV